MIHCDHLEFSYNGTPILRDITFDIQPGEFLGIIGPNGSGKTTLLKLISGLLDYTQGGMTLEGTEIKKMSRKVIAQKIAILPQETHIPFSFSALEVVLMGRAPHLGTFSFETEADVNIAMTAMQLTEVDHLKHRSINDLSGGEKQRVILARALAQQSPILLLDEPTAHLDIKHQIDIHNLVKKLNQEKKMTVVNILHDLNLASLYCHKVIMLKAGRIAHYGTPEAVMTKEAIEDVFDTQVQVGYNEAIKRPYYLPLV
jgi:iron complex transport system ATP-binding protein